MMNSRNRRSPSTRRAWGWLSGAASATMLATTVFAQTEPDTSAAALRATFRNYAAADSVVGASLLIMQNGVSVLHDNVGQGDRALNQPITDATIFHWGSITKTLTAIAIMQLRDRGRLSLDDKITRYIPELRQLHNPFGSTDDITLRMLLSHTAGTRAGTWPYGDGKPWEPFEPTRWEQLVAMMPYQQVLFKPGSKYSYSNPAFVYLARVIEQVTGDPWVHYVQKNIWTPLELTRSYVNGTPYHLEGDRSNNYYVQRDTTTKRIAVRANGRDFDPGITIPNGGWNAPLGDLMKYVAFLTNASNGNAALQRTFDTVLSRKSLQEMWTAVVPLNAAASQDGSMGLSFFLYNFGSERVIGHTGSQAGFRSYLYFNPRTARAVISVYNTSSQTQLPGASQALRDLTQRVFRYLEKSP
jgi:CubicO group peptidase (beta-lactamase class C family)